MSGTGIDCNNNGYVQSGTCAVSVYSGTNVGLTASCVYPDTPHWSGWCGNSNNSGYGCLLTTNESVSITCD